MTTDSSALRKAREAAGMTIDDALFIVRTELPQPMWISRAGISRLEKKDPAKFDGGDLFVLGVLADAYGTTIRQISPTAADEIVAVRDLLLRRIGWTSTTPVATV